MHLHSRTAGNFPALAAHPATRSLDLVFILDTVCLEETFKERRRFIRNIIQVVVEGLQPADNLRVGLIPYGPHERLPMDSSAESAQLSFAPLTSDINDTFRFLRYQKAQLSKGFEAAYEEALYTLHSFDWEKTSQRIVVTVGHRPPRPSKPWSLRARDPFDCYYQEACEKNLDWRFLLPVMRSVLRIHSFAVICPSTWLPHSKLTYTERYATICWKEIGYTQAIRFNPATAAVRQLGQTLLRLS